MACLHLKDFRGNVDLHNPTPVEFMGALSRGLVKYGIAGPEPAGLDTVSLGRTDPESMKILNGAIEAVKRRGATFLIVILPSQDASIYSYLKFYGDIKYGINTLCVCPKSKRGETALDVSDGFVANLALKINLKMGGINHELGKSQGTNGMLDNTIYFGIDVTHPTGSEAVSGAPSIAGVVANTDNSLGQWPASLMIQESRKEMVTKLKDMVIERFKSWTPQQLPARVIVYRDGVSDSQYHAVLREELPLVQEAVKEVYGKKPLPNITVVIVGKRHHTR